VTAVQLLRVLRRRWYVLLAGLCCTGFAFLSLGTSPAVYAAQADLVFMEPAVPGQSRTLTGAEPQTLIDFTAIVERKYLAGAKSAKLASPTASLFGTGIRRGTSVGMLDTGGQWLSSFNRPVLSVQAAGPSPEVVSAEIDRVHNEVSALSDDLQLAGGAGPAELITVERAPEDLIINSFGKTRMGEAKALIVLALTGTGLSCAAAAGTDALAARSARSLRTRGRGRHREAHPKPAAEPAGSIR